MKYLIPIILPILLILQVDIKSQCVIDSLNITTTDCSNGSFNAIIDFQTSGAGTDGFGLEIDGIFQGSYIYNDLPLTIQELSTASTARVCQSNDVACCIESTIFADCVCDIQMEAALSSCNADDGTFMVNVIVTGTNSSNSFTLGGNGMNFGNFDYSDSPIELGPFATDGSEYEFTALDTDNLLCFGSVNLGVIDRCPEECAIASITASLKECDDNFDRYIDFDFEVTGALSDAYNVNINGALFSTITGGADGYSLGPLEGFCLDSTTIQITNVQDPNCTASVVLHQTICCPDTCIFENVTVTGVCDAGSISATMVDFDYNGSPSDVFNIFFNDVLVANTTSASLPASIAAALSVMNPTVRIEHQERAGCTFEGDFEVDCTPCQLSNPIITNAECASSTNFHATLAFDVQAPASNSFTLNANGTLFGTYEYGELPLRIQNLPYSNNNLIRLTICDTEDNACCVTQELVTLNCSPPCEITDFAVNAMECNSDLQFNANLSFTVSNPGDNGFSIFSNGVNYGGFDYGEGSYQVGPLDGDCETIYEFIVRDNEDLECAEIFRMQEAVCCEPEIPCMISNIQVTPSACDGDGTYTMELNFDVVGNENGFFEVSAQSSFIGFFQFEDLPVTITNFPERNIEFDIITICENDNPSCCAVHEFVGLECGVAPECEISNVSAVPTVCSDDGTFFVELTFQVDNAGGSGFSLRGNGTQYGSFAYGQSSYTIGPLDGDCETTYEFIVIDNVDESCNNFTSLSSPICCDIIEPCQILNLQTNPLECQEEGVYALEIDFDFVSINAEFFDVYTNGSFINFYRFADLPVTIPAFPESGDVVDNMTICENGNSECCYSFEFQGLECVDVAECEITNVVATVAPCNDIGFFMVDISFIAENTGSEQFEIRGNGTSYGIFSYGQDSYSIGPISGDCETFYEFIIIDNLNPECNGADFLTEPVCCELQECELSNLTVQPIECTGEGRFSIELDFDFVGVTNDFFEIWGNNEFLGLLPVANLPVTIENFPESTAGNNTILVCINDTEECCIDSEFLGLACSTDTLCSINNFVAEAHTCDNGQYLIDFEFSVSNPQSQQFSLDFNGVRFESYDYGQQLYIAGPFEGDCDTAPTLVLTDAEDLSCTASFTLPEPFCCEVEDCVLSNLTVEPLECTGEGMFSIIVDFEHIGSTSESFEFWADDNYLGILPLTELPATIEDFPASDAGFQFIRICIEDNLDCCIDTQFAGLECSTDMPCFVNNLLAEIQPCEDGEYMVDLEFDVTDPTSQSFTVLFLEEDVGTFEYGETSYTVGPFVGDCSTTPSISVTDNEDPNCTATFTFEEAVCCEVGSPCDVNNIVAEANPCADDDTFMIDFEFEFSDPGIDGFSVSYNGENIETLEYGEASYTIGPFAEECLNPPTIIVRDNEFLECSATFTFDDPICCTADMTCSIGDFEVGVLECDSLNESFLASVKFIASGMISGGFSVVGNGTNYGSFLYGQEEYILGPLDSNDDTEYEFIIIDNDNPACSAAYELGIVDCTISSIEDIDLAQISALYIDDKIVILNPDLTDLKQIELYGINGSNIYSEFPDQLYSQHTLPQMELIKGIYLLRISTDSNILIIKIPIL